MELNGLCVDAELLERQAAEVQARNEELRSELTKEAERLAGCPVSVDRPEGLSDLLFKHLKMDTRYSKMTKTGRWSLNKEVLEQLKTHQPHPIVERLIEYNEVKDLAQRYYSFETFRRYVTAAHRVHAVVNQTGAATGRLSGVNPNMQGLPRRGRGRGMRQAFVASPGHVLVSADFSQIELRVLAALSGEPILVADFAAGADVHSTTASLLFGKSKEEVTAEERQVGKEVNFGTVYGQGARALAAKLNMPLAKANSFLERFYHTYPVVFQYLSRCQQEALVHGSVESLGGRRRFFDFELPVLASFRGRAQGVAGMPGYQDLKKLSSRGGSGEQQEGDAGRLRQAANTPLQGTTADLLKLSLLAVRARLAPLGGRVLLSVHDEVVAEVPEGREEEARALMKAAMAGVMDMGGVPIKVDTAVGRNLLETKDG